MSYSNLQGKIKIYRYCDNVWTFLMTNTEFRDAAEGFHADRVKIVACDGGTCLSNIISNLYSLLRGWWFRPENYKSMFSR